jgi:exonuclease VII large subunit
MIFFCLLASAASSAACVPIEQAHEHIGRDACVNATVLKVAQSQGGTYFLDFCDDYRACPFTVVVFRKNLRDVGDIRALEGQKINIHGKIKEYAGRTEIILEDSRQLKGLVAKLPPLPKNFDVEKRGSFSPGQKPKHAKPDKKPRKRQQRDTFPEDEEE